MLAFSRRVVGLTPGPAHENAVGSNVPSDLATPFEARAWVGRGVPAEPSFAGRASSRHSDSLPQPAAHRDGSPYQSVERAVGPRHTVRGRAWVGRGVPAEPSFAGRASSRHSALSPATGGSPGRFALPKRRTCRRTSPHRSRREPGWGEASLPSRLSREGRPPAIRPSLPQPAAHRGRFALPKRLFFRELSLTPRRPARRSGGPVGTATGSVPKVARNFLVKWLWS